MASGLAERIAAFDGRLERAAASTPPAAWYTAPEVFALEQAAVFTQSWQPIGRREQLAEAGSYVTMRFAGEPWLAVRGEDGVLRGFANTCRHKATPVVSGAGRVRELVCPYHGWCYGLDGKLLRVPQLGRVEHFDRSGLVPLAIAEWGPLVFVNADVEAVPHPAFDSALARALDATGWEKLRFAGRRSWEVACNWKVFCDNYLDGGYHIANRHPSLEAQLDLSTYRTEVAEGYSIQTTGGAAGADPRTAVDPAVRLAGGAIYAFLFPGFMVNRYGPALDTNHVVPLGAARCRVDFDFWFEEGCDPAFIAASMDQADLTQQEDVDVSEAVQLGLASSSYDRGRYAAPEVALHAFHCELARALQAALGAGWIP